MVKQDPVLETRQVGTTDLQLGVIGFGGASVGNLYRPISNSEAERALAAALDGGFRYFDTAPHYGHGLSEHRIGQFFGGRLPDNVVLSTKVGRLLAPSGSKEPPFQGFADPLPFRQVFDYSYDGVMRSFEDSQQRLRGLPIDILYMHDIGRATHGRDDEAIFSEAMDGGFRALNELRSSGDVKAVGLGVNEWEVCLRCLEHANPDIFMLAGRHTILEREAETQLFPVCQERQISIVAAAPFNSGLLARRPATGAHYNYDDAPKEIIRVARKLYDDIEARGGSVQSAALQFPLRHPTVVSVVGGMSSADRVQSTLSWFRTDVSDDVWQIVDSTVPHLYPERTP